MPRQKMSPEALRRLRKLRKEQRIRQRTKRGHLIRKQAKHLNPKAVPSVLPGDAPGARPVPLTKCGMCGTKIASGHADSAMCRPCYERDLLDEAFDLSPIWLPPSSGELACAAYDHEED